MFLLRIGAANMGLSNANPWETSFRKTSNFPSIWWLFALSKIRCSLRRITPYYSLRISKRALVWFVFGVKVTPKNESYSRFERFSERVIYVVTLLEDSPKKSPIKINRGFAHFEIYTVNFDMIDFVGTFGNCLNQWSPVTIW